MESTPLKSNHLYVVDDDADIQFLLRDFLEKEGFKVSTFSTPSEPIEELTTNKSACDLVLCDLKMPQMDGLEFVEKVKNGCPHLPIILMTAFGSVESAIEAMKRGAHDYVRKPLNLPELRVVVDRALRFRSLEQDNVSLRKEISRTWALDDIIGKSAEMQKIFELIRRVSQSSANILIQGESGTGKELVARAIHNHSSRSSKPFMAINCSAIPDTLLESELFGHSKGAFTGAVQKRHGLFEEAKEGTVFLDEIGDMPLALQVKLLRVLQERKVKPLGENTFRDIDVRILTASHKDLKAASKTGAFREDLFYRLSVIPIEIPPLRKRVEDIPLLAEHFLKKHARTHGVKIEGFTRNAVSKLMRLPWDGNVRELENAIERAVILCNEKFIDEADILISENVEREGAASSTHAFDEMLTLENLEKKYIEYVLEKTGRRKGRAAEILGINRTTLRRKEDTYHLC